MPSSLSMLPTTIKNATTLIDFLDHLPQEIQADRWESYYAHLPEIISTGFDLVIILQKSSFERRKKALNLLIETLPTLIKDVWLLTQVLNCLTEEQCRTVLYMINQKLPEIFCTLDTLQSFFKLLSIATLAFLLDPTITSSSGNDGEYLGVDKQVIEVTKYEKIFSFEKYLKERLSFFIRDPHDFVKLIKPLSMDKRAIVLNAMSGGVFRLIRNAQDFARIMKELPLEHQKRVFDGISLFLVEIIKNGYDLGIVLDVLSMDQYQILLDLLNDKLSEIIKTSADFEATLTGLNTNWVSKKSGIFLEIMRSKLPDLIKGRRDFTTILEYLSPTQQSIFFESIRGQLPDRIKSAEDFKICMEYLTQDRDNFFSDMINKIPNLIQSGGDFVAVSSCLSLDQRNIILELIFHKFNKISWDESAFSEVLSKLSVVQTGRFLECIQHKIPEIFEGYFSLLNTMKALVDGEHRKFFLKAMDKKLLHIFQYGREQLLLFIREWVPSTEQDIFLENLIDSFSRSIDTLREFGLVLQLFPTYLSTFYTKISPKIGDIFSNESDQKYSKICFELHSIYSFLPKNHCVDFTSAIKSTKLFENIFPGGDEDQRWNSKVKFRETVGDDVKYQAIDKKPCRGELRRMGELRKKISLFFKCHKKSHKMPNQSERGLIERNNVRER